MHYLTIVWPGFAPVEVLFGSLSTCASELQAWLAVVAADYPGVAYSAACLPAF